MADCLVQKKNLGLSKCNKLPALIRGMITTSNNFVMPKEDLEDATAWQDALLAEGDARIYLWPPFVGFENASEEAIYEDTPLSMLKVRDGKYAHRFFISENLCLHKAMYSHNGKGRVFYIDTEGQIIGTETTTGDMMGFTAALINTEKLLLSDGTVSTKTPVFVVLKNNKELDQYGTMVSAGAFVDTLQSIVDVMLTLVGTATATTIIVDVKVSCDGTPLIGLVLADFRLLDVDGAAQTIATVLENPNLPGNYTLTGLTFETGTLKLAPAADLTIKAYEVPTPLAITIP